MDNDQRDQQALETACLSFLSMHEHGGWYQKWGTNGKALCAVFDASAKHGHALQAQGIEFAAVCSSAWVRRQRSRAWRRNNGGSSRTTQRSSPRARCAPEIGVPGCIRTVMEAVANRRLLVLSPLMLAAHAEARSQKRRRSEEAEQLWLEFGAFSGITAREITDAAYAHGRETPLYSFDSFLGLPEHWRSATLADSVTSALFTTTWLSKGSFNRAGRPPYYRTTRSPVQWEVGWFNSTLPPFLRGHSRNVSLLHIDCDLYSSTAYVLRRLEARLSPGAVLAFDELINYPEYEDHELKAFAELLLRTGRSFTVLGSTAVNVVVDKEELRRRVKTTGAEMGVLGQQVVVRLE